MQKLEDQTHSGLDVLFAHIGEVEQRMNALVKTQTMGITLSGDQRVAALEAVVNAVASTLPALRQYVAEAEERIGAADAITNMKIDRVIAAVENSVRAKSRIVDEDLVEQSTEGTPDTDDSPVIESIRRLVNRRNEGK